MSLHDVEHNTDAAVNSLVESVLLAARQGFTRGVLVLSGDNSWCHHTAQLIFRNINLKTVLWVSHEAPADAWRVDARNCKQLLGQETDAVVFNAFSGFDADAFGAVTGTLRGGGLFVLCTPMLSAWAAFPDPEYQRITVVPYEADSLNGRFLRRLANIVANDSKLVVLEQGRPIPTLPHNSRNIDIARKDSPSVSIDEIYRTHDQRNAVEAVIKVVSGQRRRPAVLTSDRGRGKSSALGIAAARLLQQGCKRILVTAPQLQASEALFTQAGRLLANAHHAKTGLRLAGSSIEFVAPDELVRGSYQADLLLVDEAAAIPTPILDILLRRYSRIAFATTIHGYEGTGRGFAVRFTESLDRNSRGWRTYRLQTPIRWAVDDPLEKFVFRALCLDAEAVQDERIAGLHADDCEFGWLDRDQLVENESLLTKLFGLLVLAHYRTRPYDLRSLLDGPNIEIGVLRHGEDIVGAVVIAEEGGFKKSTADAIWMGTTRPHGHLLPESLAAHVGIRTAPELHCLRVLRIAVHPAVQCRGLGTKLIAAVMDYAQESETDYVGSSFGANTPLLRFWRRSEFVPLRVSIKRGASSGEHSVLLCRGITLAGKNMLQNAQRRFEAHFMHQLSDVLQDLEPDLVVHLLSQTKLQTVIELEEEDWLDLIAFAFGRRIYEVSVGAIWRFIASAVLQPQCFETTEKMEIDALVCKVLQKRDWQASATVMGVSGRADVVRILRHGLQKLIKKFASDKADEHISLFVS